MLRKLWVGLVGATVAIFGAGCGDSVDVSLGVNTLKQRAVMDFSAGPSPQAIVEGSSANFDIVWLCVDSNAPAPADAHYVRVAVDWQDGSPVETRELAVGPQDVAGAVCSNAGDYVVCDSGAPGPLDAGCNNWSHRYSDNAPGPTFEYPVNVHATHPRGDPNGFGNTIVRYTVTNGAPVIGPITRSAAPTTEGVQQQYNTLVSDPGLLATEIVSAVWTFTPIASTLPPETVSCDCTIVPGPTFQCSNGRNSLICGSAGATVPESEQVTFLHQVAGGYTIELAVTDKDGATTRRTTTTNIFNGIPRGLDMRNALTGAPVSADQVNPTVMSEGQTFALAGTVSDPGMDTLSITWNYDDTATFTGTASITKASWPSLVNLTPANILTPSHIWDDPPAELSHDYIVNLRAVDDDGSSAEIYRYIRVTDVNPVIDSFTVDNSTVNEGQTATFAVVAVSGAETASFDPIDANGYQWTLWRTGNPVPVTRFFPPFNDLLPTEVAVVSGCTTGSTTCVLRFLDADDAISWQVDVSVKDEDSRTLSQRRRVDVNNVLPVVSTTLVAPNSISEAAYADLTVTFTDPAGVLDGPFVATINWGYGTPDIVPLAGPGTYGYDPVLRPLLRHVYPDNKVCPPNSPQTIGTCQVQVQICETGSDNCGAGVPQPVVVNNVAPTPVIAAPAPLADLVEGVSFALDGSYSDPAAALDQLYAFAWTWTDGAIPRSHSGTSSYANSLTDLDKASGNLFTEVPAAGLSNVPITLRVTDSDTGAGTATVYVNIRDNTPSLTINGYNCPPLPAPPAARETVVCELNVTVHGETDADRLRTIDVNWGDGAVQTGLTVVDNIGAAPQTLRLTKPSVYDDGRVQPYNVTVTLHDEDSAVTDTTQIVINNVAPSFVDTVTSPGGVPVLVAEGDSVNFSVTASDPSTTDVVAGLMIDFNWGDGDTDSGIMQRRGTTNEARFGAVHSYNNPRVYTVTITVTDKDGGTVSETHSVEVLNRAPAITDVFDTGPVPEATEVTVVTLVDNPGRDVLHFTYNFNCTGPAGIEDFGVLPDPSLWTEADHSAVGTHTYFQNNSYTVCVRVCDNDGAINSCVYGSTPVEVTNVAPKIGTFTAAPNTLDEAATPGAQVALAATATDVGTSDVLTYTFYCTDEGAASTPNTTGTTTCYYPKSGVYTARVTVSDGNSGSDTRTTVVRVRNLAPTITLVSASPAPVAQGLVTTISATATDPAGDALVYSFDFNNDGVYDATSVTNSAQYTFMTVGPKTVRVRVCDDEGGCNSLTNATPIQVTNAAPNIVRVDAPTQVTAGSEVGVTIWATDAGNDTLTYGWDFDGVAGYEISSSRNVTYYTFDNAGIYRINVQVADGNGGSDTEFVEVTVTDINVLIGVQVAPQPVNEGSPVTVTVQPQGTAPYLVSFDWNGNGSFSTAEGDDVDIRLSGTTLARQHIFRDEGSVRISIRVIDNDGSGAVAQTASTIRIENVAPNLTCPTGTVTVTENTAYAPTLSATDPGLDDVLVYRLLTAPAGMAINGATGAITWLPNYTARLNNPVAVEVADGDGGTANCNWMVHVLYIDGNNDGISDAWANHYFETTNIDPDADFDGDGLTNLQEFQAGTDPTVSNAPTAPVALAPVEQYVDTFQPTLVINNSTDPDGDTLTYTCEVYQGEISGTPAHSFADIVEGQGTTSVEMGENLIDGQKYWWRCRASDGVADGPWSDATWFVVAVANHAPAQLMLLVPVDDGIVETLRPALEARPVRDVDGDVVSYDFQLYRNANLSGTPTHRVAGLADPFWTPGSNLVEDATYWWRARAVDDKGAQGAWSVVFSFVVDATPNANRLPPAPVVLVPAVDGVVGTLRPYLEVSSVVDPDGDAVTYEFRVFENSTLTGTPVAQVTGRTLPTWFVDEDLVDGSDYWWVARANDGRGTGPDSNHGHFTVTLPVTNRPPTEPGISAPAAGAVVIDTTPALTVTNATDPDGDTLTYFFEVASNLSFSGASLQVSTAVAQGTGTTAWTVPTALAEDTVYYWRCRAFDGEMAGDWAVASFRIDATNGAPTAPVPLTPADGSMLLAGPSRLVAQNGIDPEGAALTYTFEIGSDATLSTVLKTSDHVAEGDGATAWTISGVNFEQGSTYYWRVSVSDGVNSTTSAIVSFSVYKPGEGTQTPEGGCGCGCSASQPNADFAFLLAGLAALILIRRRRAQ